MSVKNEIIFENPEGELYPLLPLRDMVIFPHMVVPLFVGREKSVRALEEVLQNNQQIFLVTQKDATQDDPGEEDVYTVGILGDVLQLLKLPDGTVKVLIKGVQRARVLRFSNEKNYFQAYVQPLESQDSDPHEVEALLRTVLGAFEQYVKLNKKISPEILLSLSQVEEPAKLVDRISSHLGLKIVEKQKLLEMLSVFERLEKISEFMEGEIGVLQAERRIRGRVKRQMEKTQREYYLNEQLKAIQKELGDIEESGDEITQLEGRINKVRLSKEAKEKAFTELKKLKTMSPMAAEATVVRNYLDWLLTIPWQKKTKIQKNIQESHDLLNQDHYALEKVKERILEYIAVQNRVGQIKGSILCLVGPPGVGKTSLGKSIAKATGRVFGRISLGGVRDEAEIRGHRRTYIGSMPGKIIQAMKKTGVSNPLILLDEIDKMSGDWRGDPASALLEVLDPEQNHNFNDHYLEVDYNLADVLFITTANSLRMPQPLLDRMEIIRLSGYTEEEKITICQKHLFPKQLKYHGLKPEELKVSDEVFQHLIHYYTREAGVRSLEREIANIARKTVRELSAGDKTSVFVDKNNLSKYAGVRKFSYGEAELTDLVGITAGLAWTEVGGELLSVESVMVSGKGKMIITGKLGDVMQESIQAAASYIRSRCLSFGISPLLFDKKDIHIHLPEGATPKDGPSAGVAMCSSIVSVLTGIPVRRDIAMTGEITLRGRVLEIGGLKEKLLAAHRGGIKKVLIPKANEKDLVEIPTSVKDHMEIVLVETVDQVIEHALVSKPHPLEWTEEDNLNQGLISNPTKSETIPH